MYQRILLAYDGSPTGQNALLDCKDLANWGQSELALVAVLPNQIGLVATESGVFDSGLMEQEKAAMQGVLNEGIAKLAAAGHRASGTLLLGDTVDEIARHAKEIEADLIVVGHRHLDNWAARWWSGSVSKALIAHSPCSVLVVITH
jgi:nucleotide-binding universal stress UspA family protein